ncbi:hypothetical protein DKK70_15960 [Gilliamella apicola]|uniref:Uncharacterized protein n=1 Tax=Gilliamella apicola TaxID=1196095 RepID=A0A2V4DTY7_9GAMM|nr:hypothetical protein [Gilliamella apicola]PXZ03713.1 hypothetical protein DKK70_15960 [Gilliamella apicola]
MEFITTTILSGVIYDILKRGVFLTKDVLANNLKKWLIDDATLEKLAIKLQELNLNDEMSEKAIEREINSSNQIKELLSKISAHNVDIDIQIHSGTGDNIIGNKIINGNR